MKVNNIQFKADIKSCINKGMALAKDVSMVGAYNNSEKYYAWKSIVEKILENDLEAKLDWLCLPEKGSHGRSPYESTILRMQDIGGRYANDLKSDLKIRITWLIKLGVPEKNVSILLQHKMPDITPLVKDSNYLRNRWNEAQIAYTGNAFMASLVMYGSFMEGLLFEILTKYRPSFPTLGKCVPRHPPKASKAGEIKSGEIKEITDWTLENMLQVCRALKITGDEMNNMMHDVQKARNTIHPSCEKSYKKKITSQTCEITRNAIEAMILELIESKPHFS